MRIVVDGRALEAREGDDLLTTLARSGRIPEGCLCMAGDCPHCLAVVDGISHVRMCQTPARPGMEVTPFAAMDQPAIPQGSTTAESRSRFQRTDVVVIGGGRSGSAEAERLRAEDRAVVVIDATEGNEALAVYAGNEVVARIDDEIVRLSALEVVAATGATDIQPVAPGSQLAGILTPTAASRLAAGGVDLGSVMAVGPAPPGVDCSVVAGSVVRFEGSSRVEGVVVRADDGSETSHRCDTVVVNLGTYPRDLVARMASEGEVRLVGSAASVPVLPPCPAAGVICPCSGVTVEDLDFVWNRGFCELELLKRATLAGTGTCQGGVCSPYLRSFVADRGGVVQPTFTARPLARQMTIGEAAAGHHMPPIHRTGLDAVHRSLGARMDRMGGWWRPWTYPRDQDDEGYWAVRTAVSLGDVSTLGKMVVRGPDAAEFLESMYPSRVADLKPGRSRYALLLAESGGVLDDGLISRVDDATFALTFTSGGASLAEAWFRDWARDGDADVRIMDRTHSLGAINVTGPAATELLARAGLSEPIKFMRHSEATVAGVGCRVFRLSFTGEVSYELHHPVNRSGELWASLMGMGEGLGIKPHGLETLQRLRLEKGHIIVGVDTEPDSTPRRLGMEWSVDMDKGDFVGRQALVRTGRLALEKRLIGLTTTSPAPIDGSPIWREGEMAGYVTSATWSPILDRSVMLGWVDLVEGQVPDVVTVDGRDVVPARLPFYDPEGSRARS